MFKLFETFKKTTTAKKITVIVITVWILSIITSFVSKIIFKIDTKAILDYVNPITISAISGCMAKSTVENVATKKINGNVSNSKE